IAEQMDSLASRNAKPGRRGSGTAELRGAPRCSLSRLLNHSRHPVSRTASISEEHLKVLDGAGHILLNPHPPQTSPTGTIEAISLGSRKGAFHQVLARTDIALGPSAPTSLAHRVQSGLPEMAFKGATAFVLRAALSERTRRTDFLGGRIVQALAVGMQRFWFQELPRWTAISVCRGVIRKSRLWKQLALHATLGCGLPHVRHVRVQSPIITGQEVLDRPILAICHYRRRAAVGVMVMTVN